MAASSGAKTYIESVSPADKRCYLQKLTLKSGSVLPDPYSLPESEWMENMQKCPGLQWPDIYMYLINSPSVYTKENLKAYKSLDAVNFVLCGHVQEVKYHPVSQVSEFCVLRAKVLPSQRQGHKTELYDAWFYIHKDKNYVLTANCTCVAGLASCCSHAAAVMCRVELAVRLGLTSPDEEACTSKKCMWKDMSRKKVEPCRLRDINFARPKRQQTALPLKPDKIPRRDAAPYRSGTKKYCFDEANLMELRLNFPQAAVLKRGDKASDSDTDTASESECVLIPEPLSALYEPTARTLSAGELATKCADTYRRTCQQSTTEGLKGLEDVTRDQAECPTWHIHRIGRITGSIFHRVHTCASVNSANLVSQVMRYNDQDLSHIPAIKWGRDMEDRARASYVTYMSEHHESFSLRTAGLFVKKEQPFLAASPDGIFSCTCCGRGVLEIKCPYKYREGPTGAKEDASFCLDEKMVLKRGHQFYSQIQLQMHVCDVHFCDFFVWTVSGDVLCRVQRDSSFLAMTVPKATSLFLTAVLPELLTRAHDPTIDHNQQCEICDRPHFGKLIQCISCCLSFHYECVHIHRAPKACKMLT